MPVFVDVGHARVQTYLYRNSRLRAIRGATARQRQVTSAAATDAWLDSRRKAGTPWASRTKRNADAGDVDGVVSLVLDREADIWPVVRALLDRLRQELPEADLQAVWGKGNSYVEAYVHDIKPMLDAPVVEGPPARDLPLAKRCHDCHTGLASATVTVPADIGQEVIDVCVDCAARHTADRELRAADEGRFDPDPFASLPSPPDFHHLAGTGHRRTKNHLATVAIDGNGLGVLFEELATRDAPKDQISRALTAATRAALAAAAQAMAKVLGDVRYRPLAVHVQGGDDVLVSVPASATMVFTATFLRTFADHARASVDGYALDPPTASAGIVFAHVSHPFSQTAELAYELLRDAKRAVMGQGSSFQWVSLTHHPAEVPDQAPWRLEQLGGRAGALDALRRLWHGPSGGRNAVHELRHLADVEDQLWAAELVRAQCARLDLPGEIARLSEDEGPAVLGQGIDLTRWWP